MSKSGITIKLCIAGFLLTWFTQSHAQTQPKITIIDFVYQGPSDYFRPSTVIAPPAPAENQSTKKTEKPAKLPDIVLKPDDLQRIGVLLKGLLLKQGAYRLVPPLKTINNSPTTISAVDKDIDDKAFPESDFILFGIINYVNATTSTTSDAVSKTKTASMSLDIVGEFSLINTATKKTDVYFTLMGRGTDTRTLNIASDTIPINKIKVITNASSALANAVAQELEIQLTPALIQQRINDSELKPKTDVNDITIK